LHVIRGDAKDIEPLTNAMQGHDIVIHLASNPDIARAATEPDIDFVEGTYLTNNVVEAMRRSGTKTILYASGSGVYGDLGGQEAAEDYGPLIPISTYGASKLAGEALISAYSYMFESTGRVFRFGNVVGPRQTHGVGFDFLRQLLKNPPKLKILGDGRLRLPRSRGWQWSVRASIQVKWSSNTAAAAVAGKVTCQLCVSIQVEFVPWAGNVAWALGKRCASRC
jgi:UDP-glucose 4-epimerase